MYYSLFLVFPIYAILRKYRHKKQKLDEILLAYKSRCIADSSEYSIVTSMGNEENTIQHHLNAILSQSLPPKQIHLFVEAKDMTYDKIIEVLIRSGYAKTLEIKIEEYLKEEEFGWSKHLVVLLERYICNGKPEVIIYRSIGDALGKGLSINWLVKRNYIDTPYFLQLDADTVIEPELSRKLLCTAKQDVSIAAVYAFSYEIPEDHKSIFNKLLGYGYNIYKQISHVIFRWSWNYWNFHYTLEGPHVMFKTDVYRKIPRPLDTLAGDTAHAWELQIGGYKILANIYALDIVQEVSSVKGLYKQRMKWNSGPLQNLLIRGKKLLKSNIKYRATFSVFYYTFVSPSYQTFWLYAPIILMSLEYSLLDVLIFYAIDILIHLFSALYSTYKLRKIHEIYRKESIFDFFKNFIAYYFILRPIIAFTYLPAYIRTLLEWFIKRKRKWLLYT